ncbi:MAG: class B sortase [Lachnospiraceae bacterium]|nr:class B sortase [Lachnospiraceae bacterium]
MRKNRKYRRKNNITHIYEAMAVIATVVTLILIPDIVRYSLDAKKSEAVSEESDLAEVNEDYYCDLYILNSDISFNVVRGTDNLKYLDTAITGEKSELGTIFMDYRCDALTSPHTIIYGHDALDLAGNRLMFGKLRNFLEEDFRLNHTEICLYKDKKVKRYNIFAVKVTDINNDAYNLDFENEEQFNEFADRMGAPENTEEILTLSTCLGGENDRRLLVQGALIKE